MFDGKGLAKARRWQRQSIAKLNKGPSKGKAINLRGKRNDLSKAKAKTLRRQSLNGTAVLLFTILLTDDHSSVGASGLEEVASVDYLCRRMLQNKVLPIKR